MSKYNNYKRLTERDEFGNADIIGVNSGDLQGNLDFNALNRVTRALNRLAYFEDNIEKHNLVDREEQQKEEALAIIQIIMRNNKNKQYDDILKKIAQVYEIDYNTINWANNEN